MRAGINLPGMSPAWTHLAEKYLRLLLLHDHYRRSWQTARYLPSIARALAAVRARMDAMESQRKAA